MLKKFQDEFGFAWNVNSWNYHWSGTFFLVSTKCLVSCYNLFLFSSLSSIQYEPIRSLVRFPTNHFTRKLCQGLRWAESCLSDAYSSNSSSFSTASGKLLNTMELLFWILRWPRCKFLLSHYIYYRLPCCIGGRSFLFVEVSKHVVWFCKRCVVCGRQVAPDVLHVRIPVPDLHHLAHHLLPGHCPPLLFPSLCRGNRAKLTIVCEWHRAARIICRTKTTQNSSFSNT